MATYAIHMRDRDSHSPRNGQHAPLPSGAAIIAEYGDCLELEHGAGDEDDASIIAVIDAMSIGERLALLGPWLERITIQRIA